MRWGRGVAAATGSMAECSGVCRLFKTARDCSDLERERGGPGRAGRVGNGQVAGAISYGERQCAAAAWSARVQGGDALLEA